MSAKFTMGPWQVDHTRITTAVPVYGKGHMHIADVRGWGFLTGRGSGGCAMPDGLASVIQDANAVVIASVPEMYTELRRLVSVCVFCGTCSACKLLARIDGGP